MSVVSIRIPDEELTMFKNYAKLHNKTLSELLRNALLERMEDEFDLKTFEDYEKEKKAGTLKVRPIEELWKELEL